MSFGTYQHTSNNSNHNYSSWGSQLNEDTWNQRKRPRHLEDEDRRRRLGGPESSRPFESSHPPHSSQGHKPELHQRTAAAAAPPNDSSFAAWSDDHASPRYFHEKGHDNVHNNIMCNPRQNQGGTRGREDEGIHRGVIVGARRRSQSPPTRGYPSSRFYDMDRGYPESGGPRGNERSYNSIGDTDAAPARVRCASTGHYQEPPIHRPPPDRTFDREASSLSSHQRDSRTWYPERHGRELGNSYMNGTSDRGDAYSRDRISENDISRKDTSRTIRGYPLKDCDLRRPDEEIEFSRRRRDEDIEFSRRRLDKDVEFHPHRRHGEMEFPYRQHGDSEFIDRRDGNAEFPHRRLDDVVIPQRRPEVRAIPYGRPGSMDAPQRRPENMDRRPNSNPSRDPPRNGAYSDGYRPVSTGDFSVVDQQRLSTTRCDTEGYVSVDKKRGIDHRQEQSPPRKRINPIEPKGAPSPFTPSTMAPPARLESATKPTTFSALPNIAKAPPELVTPSIGETAQKVESANPYSMTARANAEPQTVTSSPSGKNGKDDISPTATSTSAKVIAVAAPGLAKDKTISGIPMRWLKPASKPKIKVTIPKEATKLQDAGKPKSSDIVSSMVIPRQLKKHDCSAPTSPACNRMVTDSEGGSTASTSLDLLAMVEDSKKAQAQVPVAIVTTKGADSRTKASYAPKSAKCSEVDERGGKPTMENNSSQSDSDSSDTDEDEVRNWASVMFGLNITESKVDEEKTDGGNVVRQKAPLRLRLKLSPSKIAFLKAQRRELKKVEKAAKVSGGFDGDPAQSRIKLKERGRAKKNRKTYLEVMPEVTAEEREIDEELQRIERQDEIRIREEAKPLTAAQIRAILGEDDFEGSSSSNWVRRSVRQPSLALLNSKPLKALVAGLKNDHPDMVVLKMKKYINDPDAPSCVIDAALEALEENSNCEALYIQNFNEGMRDRQVLHLLKILQSPKCRIWCMNIGENYNVEMETWDKFTKGLRKTKITHMYASEHTITTEMKDEIRETIRENRTKHDLHVNPNNLDVIVQCTHCWWNPINAKVLRPYLRKRGYEHILNDTEGQGLRGSMSEAPSL